MSASKASVRLEVDGVFAGYVRGADVLRDIGFTVSGGSIACIVGPNGAGKSTVLRTISGLLHPRCGEIRLNGTSMQGLSPAQILEHGIVQVPQSQGLFPTMTVRENVLLGGFVYRRNRALIRERYEYVKSLFPVIEERSKHLAGYLSGGQRRLIEFGRALMLDPHVVLLDEPSVGLDPTALDAVDNSIRAMAADGRAVVLIEQNIRFGLTVATDGIVMEGGRKVSEGAAADLLADEALADLYFGGAVQADDVGDVGREL